MNQVKWVPLVILVAAVFFSFFAGLGSAPLFNKDEGAFCEATREMLVSGNYVMTYMNGEPRYDKPILIYWLQAASVGAFGLNEFALRFPSALAASLWALAAWLFVRRQWDADKAFLATFLLVTAAQVTIIAKAAIADALLNLFIATAMFSIYRFFETDRKRFMYLAYAAMALGMLTKGPVAVLIPFAVSFLFCWRQRALNRWFRAVFNPVGILIFLAIALPWYAAVIHDQGMGFINGFFMKHNVKRFGGSFEGHAGSLIYYLPVALIGVMPYTGLLVAAARRVREDLGAPITQYLWIWFGFVFVLFSFSGTKLPHYVIYGYTPLFILMALRVDALRRERWLVLPAAIFFVAALAAPLVLPLVIPRVEDAMAVALLEATVKSLGWKFIAPIAAAFLLTVAAGVAPAISRRARLVVVGLACMMVVNLTGMSLAGEVLHQPVKEAAQIARDNNYDVVVWKIGERAPSFVFYSGKLTEKRLPMNGDIIFTESQLLRELGDAEILYERNGVVLAKLTHIFGT